LPPSHVHLFLDIFSNAGLQYNKKPRFVSSSTFFSHPTIVSTAMPTTNNNDSSHTLGHVSPHPSGQSQSTRALLRLSSCSNGLVNTPNQDPNPSKERADYDGALQYLFSKATQDPAARDLCREIELKMSPPFRDGVLQCLLRLQAIDRIEEWPVLFGKDNPFILYMLYKISNSEFPVGSTEKTIWDLRRKETTDWLKQRIEAASKKEWNKKI
ncbi:hypothetical protein BGZ65_000113, partial [Modicella reniformis]